MLALKKGHKIFKVYARANVDTPDDEMKHVANIIAKTDFRTSNWADERLHFNHQNIVFDNKGNTAWWAASIGNM